MKRTLLIAGLALLAACREQPPATPNVAPLLDGRAALQPALLAELSYRRARLGGLWLAGALREDGSFYYTYNPERDAYEERDYNEVRHAGTTYALWTLYGATRSAGGGDERIRQAAEAASGWIDRNAHEIAPGQRAFIYEGRMKLGGQALALVALLERRRVTGDTRYDPLIAGLARFLLAMELKAAPGRYHQSYDARQRRMLLTPPSNYYPGEALLALTRLAQQDFMGGPWLAAARRAARYLIYEKDGDIIAAGKVPREDHWLTMALAELYRLSPDEAYRKIVYLQAQRMMETQYGADAEHPQKIGAGRREPLNYTSTATKGEALVAAWGLAAKLGDRAAARRFADGAMRNAQFRLRVQWLPANAGLFPKPRRLYGGWGANPADPYVRIDFVQHNISALLGIWYLGRNRDLPIAGEAAVNSGGAGEPVGS